MGVCLCRFCLNMSDNAGVGDGRVVVARHEYVGGTRDSGITNNIYLRSNSQCT